MQARHDPISIMIHRNCLRITVACIARPALLDSSIHPSYSVFIHDKLMRHLSLISSSARRYHCLRNKIYVIINHIIFIILKATYIRQCHCRHLRLLFIVSMI